jgi:hypothetical protein
MDEDAKIVEKLKSFGLGKLQKVHELADPNDPDMPLVLRAINELGNPVRTIAPTGERAEKLKRDIEASQSPLPGGQWAQPVEAVTRYIGLTGGDGSESAPASALHQANATSAAVLGNIPMFTQGMEAIGEQSDRFFPGQNPKYNVFPRPGGTRQLIQSAPSPLLAEATGVLPYAAAGAAKKAIIDPVTEVAGKALMGSAPGLENSIAAGAEALVAPIQGVAKAMPLASKLPGTVLPAIATQVGLNAAMNSVNAAGKLASGKIGGGQAPSVMGDLVAPSLDPESLGQAALFGSIPAPRGVARTKSQKLADTYADVMDRNGGQIPAELDGMRGDAGIAELKGKLDTAATEQKRSFADKFLDARQQASDAWNARKQAQADSNRDNITSTQQQASDAWNARKQAQADSNRSSIADAKKSADEAVASTAASQEEPARKLYTAAKEDWLGKGGKGGNYQKGLDTILSEGARVEPDTKSLDQLAKQYESTSEPAFDPGSKSPKDEQVTKGGRAMSIGRAVAGLVSDIKAHLGSNPSLREYQNAIGEAAGAVEKSKATPRAKQAFTEVVSALRADAYSKFPNFGELSTRNQAVMSDLETFDQSMYGNTDARIGKGLSDAKRGEVGPDEGGATKVPMSDITRASKWLAGEGQDPATAHTYESFRKLGGEYSLILDTIKAVRDHANGYVSNVEGKANAASTDLEDRSTRSMRNIKSVQTEKANAASTDLEDRARRSERNIRSVQTDKQRDLNDTLAEDKAKLVNEKTAVEASRFPSLGKVAIPAIELAAASHYHGPYAATATAGALAHAAYTMAPYVRGQVAYRTPNSLRVDPELLRTTMLPAISGPLAFEKDDPFKKASPLDRGKAFYEGVPIEKYGSYVALVDQLVQSGKTEEQAKDIAKTKLQLK